MKIDHIGYAVRDIDKARTSFEILGFSFEEKINDCDRNVVILFGNNEEYRIELVSRLNDSMPSPIDTVISSGGPMPYHFCYYTREYESDLDNLKNNGFKIIVPPAPAVAFGGKKVTFLYNLKLGLIEVVED